MDTGWPSFKYYRKIFETVIWGSCSPFLQMNIFPHFLGGTNATAAPAYIWAPPTPPPTPPQNPTPKVQCTWRYFALTRLITQVVAVTARLEFWFFDRHDTLMHFPWPTAKSKEIPPYNKLQTDHLSPRWLQWFQTLRLFLNYALSLYVSFLCHFPFFEIPFRDSFQNYHFTSTIFCSCFSILFPVSNGRHTFNLFLLFFCHTIDHHVLLTKNYR